ncbi:MAG: hypothetical protein QOJ59_4471 [Thermomicrobiales bacterium]|jgi:hypothetical protein|nr:hypothetical protein [Thermomicrobiales bacterium]
MRIELRRVVLPEFGIPVERPAITTTEYEQRARALYEAVGLDRVVVYGDREHFGNLVWLSGYDPRFEEALLLLGPRDQRVLLVGIEGVAYAEVTGLPVDVRFYHPFSIQGQPHVDSPPLEELLREVGLDRVSRVGVVGWKSLDPGETDDPTVPAFVPAFILRALNRITEAPALDVTAAMTDAERGLRTRNSAAQIALFEWGAARSSAAVMRVVRGARPGMTELEAAGLLGYQGEPVTMHPIVAASNGVLNGLRSPSARVISRGEAISCGVGYWGGLTCRAGLLLDQPDEEFVASLVRPYYTAIATWWTTVGIGVSGGELDAAVRNACAGASFGSFVNAGHLTSYDEWIGSPVRTGSTQRVASGMMMQCDIIPSPVPPGRFLNCEDTLAIGDESVREMLAREHPAVWSRIEARRAFMRDELGLRLRPEVLPLSSAPAYLPPFWLASDLVCVVDS